jgi:hypothetical protein
VTNNPPPQHASLAELVAAIDGLTEAERLRLARKADHLAYGTEYAEGQELMNEAVSRALLAAAGVQDNGHNGRAWPQGVHIVAFLSMTMRGLASDSHKSVGQKVAKRMQALVGDEGEESPALAELELNHAPVDEELIEHREREVSQLLAEADVAMIEAYFAQDQNVLAILEGEREEMSAQEMRDFFEMDKITYDTARTRLRRGLDKLMPGRRRK